MNQHDSPESEGVARAAQFAAMSMTLIEAMARLRAQRQTERAEADALGAQAARAERLASHAAARVAWAPGLDDEWLRSASTVDVGRAWAAATPWAETDVEAADAVHRTEARLYQLHPDAMTDYAHARAEGLDPSAAMQRAADQFVERPALEEAPTVARNRSAREVADDGYPLPASMAVKPRPSSTTSTTHVITSVPTRRAQTTPVAAAQRPRAGK